jgi:type II secretory ATPase GspE/PulE/Tfp pilus assembly ATPase PilB-like protein
MQLVSANDSNHVINEKDYRFIPYSSIFNDGFHVSDVVKNNTKLIQELNTGSYFLYIISEYGSSTDIFDLLKAFRKKEIRVEQKFCSREKLKEISDDLNAADSSESQSDIQAEVLRMLEHDIKLRGSDCHILAEEDYAKVAFRVDGQVRQMPQYEASAEHGQRLIHTIYNSMCDQKEPPDLNFTECCYARFKDEFAAQLGLNGVRVTTRPAGGNVMKMVLRLIPRKKDEIRSFEALGLTRNQQKSIRRVIAKPAGAIVISGPMGHGKSTLSQLLAEAIHIKHPGKHLISVEDPVESPIPGWFQTPLLKGYDADIANLMRMDGNGLYIGEIRDSDAANGVISAAQTGNIVITTIHTEMAIDIINRLKKMGVDDDLLMNPGYITCLVGLKLTPILCDHCKKAYESNKHSLDEESQEVVEKFTHYHDAFIHNPEGCQHCGFSGYKGRTGVFEVIETDYKFMKLYIREGMIEALQYWKDRGGETLCSNIKKLINQGLVDPVKAHETICPLDRDEILYECH